MKKFILLLVLFSVLVSCTKNSEQLDVVKKDLKDKNISDKEMESFKFNVNELLGKDAHDLTYKEYSKYFEVYQKNIDTLVRSKKYNIFKDKTYYKVLAYRLSDKDTTAKSIYYLTDKNKIFSSFYIK